MQPRWSRVSFSLAAALSFGLIGCGAEAPGSVAEEDAGATLDDGKQDGAASPLGAAQGLWSSYVSEIDASTLQPGCRPFRSTLPSGVRYHGVVVLLHGFTACPQQFEELSKQLGAQGMVVLAPLLPGHGRRPQLDGSGNARDDVAGLPEDGDFAAYTRFAHRMDAILSAAPGVRVVGGISVGGAIAARVAADGTGADRAVLMNSFFDASGFVANLLAPANALVPRRRMSWGPGCEAERKRGRAGICQFEFTHLRAVQRFGLETAATAPRISVNVQNLGVEDDHAARPSAIAAVASKLGRGTTCFFEAGVNHSLLSRFDSPDEDKFWLPATLDQLRRFVATGEPFDTDGSSAIPGYPRCRAR